MSRFNQPYQPYQTEKEHNAYIEGMIHGITMYAIWRNGEQLVGCMQRPLKKVIAEIREQEKYNDQITTT